MRPNRAAPPHVPARRPRPRRTDELQALIDGLNEDQTEALGRLAAHASHDHGTDHDHDEHEATVEPADIRATSGRGRLNGQMESVAILLSDAALADCIEQLGDNSDSPTEEQLVEVLPGIIERHGLAATRLMLASTVAGEANAAATIRELLKSNDLVKFPKEEPRRIVPALERTEQADDPERRLRSAAEAKRLAAKPLRPAASRALRPRPRLNTRIAAVAPICVDAHRPR